MDQYSIRSATLSASLLVIGALWFAPAILTGATIDLPPMMFFGIFGLAVLASFGLLAGYAVYLSSRDSGWPTVIRRTGQTLGAVTFIMFIGLLSSILSPITVQWIAFLGALFLPLLLRPALAIGATLSVSSFGVAAATLHQTSGDAAILAILTTAGAVAILFYSIERMRTHLAEQESVVKQSSKLVFPATVILTLVGAAGVTFSYVNDGEILFPIFITVLAGAGILLSRTLANRSPRLNSASRIVISSALGLLIVGSLFFLTISSMLNFIGDGGPYGFDPFASDFSPPTDPEFFQVVSDEGDILYTYTRDFETKGAPGLSFEAISGDAALWTSTVGVSDDSTLSAGPISIEEDGSFLLTGGIEKDGEAGIFIARFSETGEQTTFDPYMVDGKAYARPLELFSKSDDGTYIVLLLADNADDRKRITVWRLDDDRNRDWSLTTSLGYSSLGYFEPIGHQGLQGQVGDDGKLTLFLSGEMSSQLLKISSRGKMLLDKRITDDMSWNSFSHIDNSGRVTILTESYDPGPFPWSMGGETRELLHLDENGDQDWVLSTPSNDDYLMDAVFDSSGADIYMATIFESMSGYEGGHKCDLTKISYGEIEWRKELEGGGDFYGPGAPTFVKVEPPEVTVTCGEVKAIYSVDGELIDTEQVESPMHDEGYFEPPFPF